MTSPLWSGPETPRVVVLGECREHSCGATVATVKLLYPASMREEIVEVDVPQGGRHRCRGGATA